MADTDVTKYAQVIKDVLRRLRVRKSEWEDLTQECYVALLEKQPFPDYVENDEKYAAALCRNTVLYLWRDRKKEIKTESLDDPRYYARAVKLVGLLGTSIPEEKLQEAILALPWEEYQVIYSLFVEGLTQEQTGDDLGLSRKSVRTLSAHGVNSLRRYFEDVV